MKQILISILLVISLATGNNAQDLLLKDSTSIAKLMDSIVTTNFSDNKIPGAVICVVHQGRIVYNKGFGVENFESKKAINPNTSKFRVASITKTFTALAIMQLIEQGKLELHADIRTYLPSSKYPFDAPYSFTIHDLLTHTAGFEWSSVRVSKEATEDRQLETFVKTSMNKQIFKPGEVFYYSNKGYGILGLLIEKMSGMKYEDYIDQNILPALGMNNSTTYQHTVDAPIANIVTPYWPEEDGFTEIKRQKIVNPAASTLNTTGLDMARFMIAMLNRTKTPLGQILKAATYETMSSTQYRSLVPDQGMAYGMGIGHYRSYRGLSHGGGIEGFGSYYTFYPELELGLFMVESGGEGNAWFVFKNIFDALGELVPEQETTFVDLKGIDIIKQGEKCKGLYQLVTVTQTTFEKGRRIFGIDEVSVNHLGDGRLQIDDRIFSPIGDLAYAEEGEEGNRQIGFGLNEKGEVQYLGNGTIYATFEKIKWYKSYRALQLGLGLGIFLIITFLIGRPVYKNKKRAMAEAYQPHIGTKRTYWTVGLLLGGFLLLLLANMLNLSMTTGTHIGFKVGLIILTLGALLTLTIPYDIYQLWKNEQGSNKEKVLRSIGLFGLALVCICFWDINLIGMNWY